MRTDFCSALLKCLPCLTIYGNIYIGEKVRSTLPVYHWLHFRLLQVSDSSGSSGDASGSDFALEHSNHDLVLQSYERYSIIRMDIPD